MNEKARAPDLSMPASGKSGCGCQVGAVETPIPLLLFSLVLFGNKRRRASSK